MVELFDALLILMLGYASIDGATKHTWTLLQLLSGMLPVTSGNLARFAEIRGCHAETMRRHFRVLEDAGLLSREEAEGDLVVYLPLWPDPDESGYRDAQTALSLLMKVPDVSAESPEGVGDNGLTLTINKIVDCSQKHPERKEIVSAESPEEVEASEIGKPGQQNRWLGVTPYSPPLKGGVRGCFPTRLPGIEAKEIGSWTSADFLRYANRIYVDCYRHVSLELEGSVAGQKRQGVILSRFKRDVLARFIRLGLSKADVRDYLDWLFETKAERFENIGIGVICSPAIQDGFLSERVKREDEVAGRVDVSEEVGGQLRCRRAERGEVKIPDGEAWRLFDPDDELCKVCLRRAVCAEMWESEQ